MKSAERDVRAIHAAAAAGFAQAADRVTRDAWLEPRAAGKWSPAEIVTHLNLTYDVLLREILGGPGMAVRTSWWQRLILRFTVLPRILRDGVFPEGARAPREVRPPAPLLDQEAAVEEFREKSAQFEALCAAADPERTLTHAYFGNAPLAKAMLLCARHIEHHARQLERH